jgi:hypothetical protein
VVYGFSPIAATVTCVLQRGSQMPDKRRNRDRHDDGNKERQAECLEQ